MKFLSKRGLRVLRFFLTLGFTMATVGVLGLGGAYLYLAPDLPSAEILKDVRLQVPLRVFSEDGALVAEFGEKRRSPVRYEDIPEKMVQAFLAAEDDRFFAHPGIDYQGLLRAALHLVRTGQRGQGGSTITMQVARNFFLSREKTYVRKLNEIFLALKIERELSKQEILELYLNKIYFGNRAHGIQAAAEVYYGTEIQHLTLAQIAMIAGLPKSPSSKNPIANPIGAAARRNYVLRRMRELAYIDEQQLRQARGEGLTATLHGRSVEVQAPYVAEMVRAEMVKRYGDAAYREGFRVFTTVNSELQKAANQALHSALLEYDRRHGYRKPVGHLEWLEDWNPKPASGDDPEQSHWVGAEVNELWDQALGDLPTVNGLRTGLIVGLEEQRVEVYLGQGNTYVLPWETLEWARPFINVNQLGPKLKQGSDLFSLGDLVYLQPLDDDQWQLAQMPEVEGALVSLNPSNGAIKALVGGFDYYQSKFNRVTQARRQPGSSFKPFIYSAALEKGFTPASIINDAPVVFEDPGLENTWRPENYTGKFYGPTRLREALVNSRNLVSIRLLREIGIEHAVRHIANFGLDPASLPRDLSLALGSVSLTPLQLASGYAIFANGGYQVQPFFIERIEDENGKVVFRSNPAKVCLDCPVTAETTPLQIETVPESTAAKGIDDRENEDTSESETLIAQRVISEQNVYLITSMMRDVVRRGTGRRAMSLGRQDLAGKTGTTNDQRDAWFSGFNRRVVTTAWVGFDKVKPLGNRETGGRAALPMWIEYMATALRGVPQETVDQPAGLVTVRIDPKSGLLANSETVNPVWEIVPSDQLPKKAQPGEPGQDPYLEQASGEDETNLTEQLF